MMKEREICVIERRKKVQGFIDFVQNLGIVGIFIATAIEAAAIPFPCTLSILLIGSVLQLSIWKILIVSAANTVIYIAFNYIPFVMAYRFESITKRWFGEKNIKRAQKWFHKYGKWSITISRPISIANYITYLAGLSKIKSRDFVLYSTLGIFPWFVFLLYVGGLGDIEKIQKYLHDVDRLIFVTLIIGVIVGAGWWMKKRRESHAQE